jgi:hypothetical protein
MSPPQKSRRCCGADDGRILFFAERDDRLVVHFHDFGGVDDADAMVAETARRERGMYFGLVADEENGGDFFIFLQRAFDTRDDDATTVVAAHDIHCDTHR